jgi:hypothetical protein
MLNSEQRKFLKLLIANHGDHIEAYVQAYNMKNRKKAATAGRQLALHPEVKQKFEESQSRAIRLAEKKAAEQLAKEYVTQALSMTQKRDILFQIATGTLTIKKTVSIGGKAQTVDAIPDFNDRKNAIELDSRLMGEFAAEKREITGKDGTDLVPKREKMTDDQFTQVLNMINNGG